MFKVVTILGARPQFIKASALSRSFIENKIQEIIVHTGQHFSSEMSDLFFNELSIPEPKYNLNINQLSHGAMLGKMIEGIEIILTNEHPDFVLVYGDTNSTLAGALAASKLHIPIAHIEAGLRSFNSNMPEEINRILTDRISTFLFCPTDLAIKNLEQEGVTTWCENVHNVGDIMFDVFQNNISKIAQLAQQVQKEYPNKKIVVATIHRQENTNDPAVFSLLIENLNKISQLGYYVLLFAHPRIKSKLVDYKVNFEIKEPVGYLELMAHLQCCDFVFTDSGGLQKEAYFNKKPVVIARDTTEWTEITENKLGVLAYNNWETTYKFIQNLPTSDMFGDSNYYSFGSASSSIVNHLKTYYSNPKSGK